MQGIARGKGIQVDKVIEREALSSHGDWKPCAETTVPVAVVIIATFIWELACACSGGSNTMATGLVPLAGAKPRQITVALSSTTISDAVALLLAYCSPDKNVRMPASGVPILSAVVVVRP